MGKCNPEEKFSPISIVMAIYPVKPHPKWISSLYTD